MATCVIGKVYEPQNHLTPCIVKFNNSMTEAGLKNSQCELFVDDNEPPSKKLILLNNDKTYSGTVKNANSLPHRSFLLIRNKRKNTASIIPVEHISASEIRQPKIAKQVETPTTDYKTQHNELIYSFGSKKSQRLVSGLVKMSINNVLESSIKDTIAGIEVESDVDIKETITNNILQLLPRCNRSATTVEGVYLLEDVIMECELHSLRKAARALKKNPPKTIAKCNEKYSLFFSSCFVKLGPTPSTKQIQLLLYADSLMSFLNNSRIKYQKAKRFDATHSELVAHKIRDEFSKGELEMNAVKAICHLIVVLLLTFKYKLDLALVTAHLTYRITMAKLLNIFKVVGCTEIKEMVGDVKTTFYVLSLPLPNFNLTYTNRQKRNTMS